MPMDTNAIKNVKSFVGISSFIGGLVIGGISIYWLYSTYQIHSEVRRIYLIQEYCGSDVMEKETLRYQLKNGSLQDMFSSFQKTVVALSVIGIVVSLLGMIGHLWMKNYGYVLDMNIMFQFTIFIVIIILFLVLLHTYQLNITNTDYDKKWIDVKNALNTILTNKYNQTGDGEEQVFIKNKLATFAPSFVKELVQRYRNEKYVLSSQDPSLEMVYSDQGIISELENMFFPQQGSEITVQTEAFLPFLRPEMNLDPITKERKRDLDYIDEAYRGWACDSSNIVECKNDAYVVHLPDLSFYNLYPSLQNTLGTYRTLGWILFVLMLYTFYHQYYAQDRSIQVLVLIAAVVLFIIIMYYMMALRYDL